MSDIKSRLLQFTLSQGLTSLGALERNCGFAQNTIQKISGGVNTNTLVRIAEVFPALNLNWLILGRGPMLVEESPQAPQPAPSVNVQNIETVNIGNWDVLGEIVHKAITSALKNQ